MSKREGACLNKLKPRHSLVIIIPTYRRTDRQVTFEWIPPEWQSRVAFVLDEKDKKVLKKKYGYTGCSFVVHPIEIDSIAKKRAWIIKQKEWDKILMLDDDLRLDTRRGKKEGSDWFRLLKATPEEAAHALRRVESKLDKLVHVGIGARQYNRGLQNGWNYNKRMMYALGYRTSVVRKVCELGRIEHREDMDYTLQLLKLGFQNAIRGDFAVGQAGLYNSKGGVSASGRTIKASNADAVLLAKLHPGLVKVVEREYSKSLKRQEVICYWEKAYGALAELEDSNVLI